MKLRTPWQAAASVGVRLPKPHQMTLADAQRVSEAFGVGGARKPRRRRGEIEREAIDVAREIGWPGEGGWCE